MSAPDPKLHIVRPFGLIGGKYEVDAAGVRKYWLAFAIVAIFIGVGVFRESLGVPIWGVAIAAVISIGAAYVLCADVVRKGRRVE